MPAAQAWNREGVHGRARCRQRERSCSQPCWDDDCQLKTWIQGLSNLARAWRLLGLGPDPKGLLSFQVQTYRHIWSWALFPQLQENLEKFCSVNRQRAFFKERNHTSGSRSHRSFLCSFVLLKFEFRSYIMSYIIYSAYISFVMKAQATPTHPLYPPNIKSLPFRLIAEWLLLPAQFKVSQESSECRSLSFNRFTLMSSWMSSGFVKYCHHLKP